MDSFKKNEKREQVYKTKTKKLENRYRSVSRARGIHLQGSYVKLDSNKRAILYSIMF